MDDVENARNGHASVHAFWQELDTLRRVRGLSYKRLERQTRIAASTLQYWMNRSSRLVPWLQVRAVVVALEASERTWFDRWKAVDQASTSTAGNGRTGGRRVAVPTPRAPTEGVSTNRGPVDRRPPVDRFAAHAQLPMDLPEFTGRAAELRLLHEMLSPDHEATAPVVSLITGMAGIGKTRLAVHIGHQLKHHNQFADVALFANLGGCGPGRTPADPAAVLEGFLRLLGVPAEDLPSDVDMRAALYRDRLDGRRAIVLLDDAANEDQVECLLPASPTCRVLVTSRRRLAGLDGAQPVPLGLLTPTEAVAQLGQLIGHERVAAEAGAAEEIVRHCGYLPLAVAVAARRLRARPTWALADLARRLEPQHSRLGELAVSDRSVRTAFDRSYGRLPAELRRMFRLLGGLHPGSDCTAHSAAALADTVHERAEELLERLLDEHLLEQATRGRYRFHGLLRRYARERVDAEETAADRAEAVRRVLVWYLHNADRADRRVAPRRRRFPLDPTAARTGLLPFDRHGQALRWFDAEHANLVAVVRQAAAEGMDGIVWRLAAAMYGFFDLRRNRDDWISTCTAAVAATRRLADEAAEAHMLNDLGEAYRRAGRLTESIECFQRALSIRCRIGDLVGQAETLQNLEQTVGVSEQL
jgi:NB-ARC domain/Tetratricopeptide repeat